MIYHGLLSPSGVVGVLWVARDGLHLSGDGLHLSGKGAAVFAEGLSGAVASGLGKVRYLN